MKRKRYPCCGYLTIDNADEVIVDICEVCYWQYDEVLEEKPDEIIGPKETVGSLFPPRGGLTEMYVEDKDKEKMNKMMN